MDTETDYNALFGVDAGGNEQEPAEPANVQEQGSEGENEQGSAAPADGNGNAGETGEQKQTQTPEQNAAFAAARRKAEQERDAEIARIKNQQQAAIDAAIAKLGLTNTYTGKAITTQAEAEAYTAQHGQEERDRVMRDANLSPDEFNRIVDSLPQVQQAKAAQARAEAAERQARENAAAKGIEEQVKQISALDPSIKSLDDLIRHDSYQRIYSRVRSGMGLRDAYIVENFDALRAAGQAAGRQAALNAATSKDHLASTTSRGAGAQTVPPDVMELYRQLMPDATTQEIQNHYNRSHKRT